MKEFEAARKRAEQTCPYADMDAIYEYLEDWYDWDEETTNIIRDIELGVEKDVLVLLTFYHQKRNEQKKDYIPILTSQELFYL